MAKEGFGLEITELRLGLPGGGPDHNQYSSSCGTVVLEKKAEKKRVFSDMISDENSSNVGHKKVNNHQSSCNKRNTNTSTNNNNNSGQQIVGWPPVRSYRKKNNSTNYYASAAKDQENTSESEKLYVKVSMDGIPYLRKIDLNTHEAYSDLALAFQKLFGCYGIVDGGMLRDSENSEYIPIYEDKDGDWMLVGDVPWEMFIESCKRLRIMKRTEKGKSFAVEQRNFKGQVEGAGEVGGAEWNRIGL